MEAWLKSNFPSIGDGQVCVLTTATGSIGFDPSDPSGVFASVATLPPTYAALSALPCAAQGWQKVFDKWKAAGKVA